MKRRNYNRTSGAGDAKRRRYAFDELRWRLVYVDEVAPPPTPEQFETLKRNGGPVTHVIMTRPQDWEPTARAILWPELERFDVKRVTGI